MHNVEAIYTNTSGPQASNLYDHLFGSILYIDQMFW